MKKVYENSAEYREVPQMTRSEYIAEYTDITTYFEQEKKTLKKLLPFCITLSVINVIVEIILLNIVVPAILDNNFITHRERENAFIVLAMPCVLSFPLVSIIVRMKQIKNKENERLQDLEDRKNLCIEIGTYNAEE